MSTRGSLEMTTAPYKALQIPVIGLNASLLALGIMLSFTRGGMNLYTVFYSRSMIDFALLSLVFMGAILLGTVWVFKDPKGIWEETKKKKLAAVESVFGLAGVALLGALGMSPAFVVLPVVASLFLRGQGVFPALFTAGAGLTGLLLAGQESSYMLLVLGALGMTLAVLGTMGLEPLMLQQSYTGYVHYMMILCIMLGALAYSPMFLVVFPLVALVIVNFSPHLKKSVKALNRRFGISSAIYSHITSRSMQKLFTFLLNLTKIVLVALLGLFVGFHFISWYTNNPILIQYFKIEVTEADAPFFVYICKTVMAVVDGVTSRVLGFAAYFTPQAFIANALDTCGMDIADLRTSKNVFAQGIVLIYNIMDFSGHFIKTLLYLIFRFTQRILGVFNYIPGTIGSFARKVSSVLNFAKYIYSWTFGWFIPYHAPGALPATADAPLATSYVASAGSNLVWALTLPIRAFGSGCSYLYTGAVFLVAGAPAPPVLTIAPEVDTFNPLNIIVSALIKGGAAVLGGYQYMVLSNWNEAFSTKTYNLTTTGFEATIPLNVDYNIDSLEPEFERATFYKRFMETYCRKSNVLTYLDPAGAFEETTIFKDKEKNNFAAYMQGGCARQGSSRTIEAELLSIGGAVPNFSIKEKNAISSAFEYFPDFKSKTEEESVLRLKEEIKEYTKYLKAPTKIEKLYVFKLLSIFKKYLKVQYASIAYGWSLALKEDLAEYYRQYYYRFLILSQHFLDGINGSIEKSVSSSAVSMFNTLIQSPLDTCTKTYLEDIIKMRLAILKKELPFLTEKEAVDTFYSRLRDIIEPATEPTENGYFLKRISLITLSEDVVKEMKKDLPLQIKRTSKFKNPKVIDGNLVFAIRLETLNYNKTASNRVITHQSGHSLTITDSSDDTVIMVSVNNHPIATQAVSIGEVNGCSIEINVPKTKLDSLIGGPSVPAPRYTVQVSVYSNHVGLVHHLSYEE
ncbi:hypothetical protein NEDG_01123 [Nematocida displodere]|uniref:Uncharacterized protein n=1 Tax=Nematocida displodere TaxID=1805483 RepID=A0A177EAM0_9MICR|nr:hypothetical protein NEDG_01123 [Nematocida displodere]